MVPCPACAAHVRASDAGCVHCGATLPRVLRGSVVAALLGLSACVGTTTKDTSVTDTGATDTTDTTTAVEPPYGVPTSTPTTITDTDTAPTTGETGDTGAR